MMSGDYTTFAIHHYYKSNRESGGTALPLGRFMNAESRLAASSVIAFVCKRGYILSIIWSTNRKPRLWKFKEQNLEK